MLTVCDLRTFAFSHWDAGSVSKSDMQALSVSICSEALFYGLVFAGISVADAVGHPLAVFEDSEIFVVNPAFCEPCW